MSELYIGLMSGTSMDGIDAAVVDFAPDRPRLVACHTLDYPRELRKDLFALAAGTTDELALFARLDTELGHLFAQAARAVMNEAGVNARRVAGIGSHGQTVRHYPLGDRPTTLQIADPNVIATQTGVTTVADLRRRDMSVGGQGAPLAPAIHEALFRTRGRTRAVVNIGGIANITVLPGDTDEQVTGFDSGPGNALMDRWVERHLRRPMDVDGQWAASGRVDDRLLERFMSDPYFGQAPPKSTGTSEYGLHWLDAHLQADGRRLARKNVQATLCELTARTIAEAIERYAPDASEVLVCGGGARNLALMFRLQVMLGETPVRTTEDYGYPPEWIETIAFAWLARQTLSGRPGNLPSVTGASRAVVLGGIYPANAAGITRSRQGRQGE